MEADTDKIRDPIAPDTVLFGLILVNFLPLKILPKIKPPRSEAIQINKIIKINIFNPKDEEKVVKIKTNTKIYNIKTKLIINCLTPFFM